jgi:hypothetical protein
MEGSTTSIILRRTPGGKQTLREVEAFLYFSHLCARIVEIVTQRFDHRSQIRSYLELFFSNLQFFHLARVTHSQSQEHGDPRDATYNGDNRDENRKIHTLSSVDAHTNQCTSR